MREAILKVRSDGRLVWRRYSGLQEVLSACTPMEVVEVLQEVERRAQEGHACVGWVAYEAAGALNPALQTHAPKPSLPLAHFGVFAAWEDFEDLPLENPERKVALDWRPDIEPGRYAAAIACIRQWIAAGDTYQVNFTHRLHAIGSIVPGQLFESMSGCPRTAYSAFIETDGHAICCASPELFFELDGDLIRTSPMKGTAPRGLDTQEDARLATALANSEKDRAENLMILDMARNDLGKIAEVGSVRVVEPFKIERFATVHQMTSAADATTHASLAEIFRALFPAASMTGAPKRRTMEIIRELESSPRGAYSGCIGVVGPGRQARFGVAIRTAVLDKAEGTWEYGVGGGIVWDSNPESELRETQTKTAVLTSSRPDFKLIETLRWSRVEGYALLDRHLARLLDSARYFDWTLDEQGVCGALLAASAGFEGDELVVRLTVGRAEPSDPITGICPQGPTGREKIAKGEALETASAIIPQGPTGREKIAKGEALETASAIIPQVPTGREWIAKGEALECGPPYRTSPEGATYRNAAHPVEITTRPFAPWPEDRPLRLALSTARLEPDTLWTHHKTDQRGPYVDARAEHPDCDEVLLLNTRGELADGTISNIAVFIEGTWLTPPLESGALPGVLRAELLETSALIEAPIPLEALGPDTPLKLFNSVRGISQPIPWKDIKTAIGGLR